MQRPSSRGCRGWASRQRGEWVQLGARALVTGASARLLVGDVAIQRDVEQPHTFELGITLARDHQRVGHALEALHGVIGWLMRDHDAHRTIMRGDASGLSANVTAPSTERGKATRERLRPPNGGTEPYHESWLVSLRLDLVTRDGSDAIFEEPA